LTNPPFKIGDIVIRTSAARPNIKNKLDKLPLENTLLQLITEVYHSF